MIKQLGHKVVDGWLSVARIPADLATKALPDGEAGPRAKASLLIDRTDAAARIVVGGILRDEALHVDGKRRRAAALERRHALRLRGTADAQRVEADHKARQEHAAADQKRSKARAEAAAAKEVVVEEQEERKAEVEENAEELERYVEEAKGRVLEQAEKQTKKARLAALDDRADALDAEAAALTAADEAERLADAAAAAKAQRKQAG